MKELEQINQKIATLLLIKQSIISELATDESESNELFEELKLIAKTLSELASMKNEKIYEQIQELRN